jgi:hypothetical protein
MRVSYIIRQVNSWFARVVNDPDRWDQRLQRAAGGKDFRVAFVLLFASGVIWLTRRILSLLMRAGHTISCFMLRQMEYDADSYQYKVAGSDNFVPTHFRIRTLQMAAQTALGDMRESWRSGRLPEDYPDFVTRKAGMLSQPVLQQLQQAIANGKTKTFDTHPADADRGRAALDANAPGVFNVAAPAARLFADFPRLSRELTRFYYEKQHHLALRDQNLVNNDESSNESAANLQRQQALQAFLFGVNTGFFPIIFSPDELAPPADWKESVKRLRAARDRLAGAAMLAQLEVKQHANADAVWSKAASAHYLLACGFTVPAQQFGLSAATPEATKRNLNTSNAEMDRTGIALKVFAEAAGIENAAALRQEVLQLASTLAALGQVLDPAHKIRRRLPALDLMLANRKNHKQPAKVDDQIRIVAGELRSLLDQIQAKLQTVLYPFPHARGQISLAEYARTDTQVADALQTILNESRAGLDRLFGLYYRILGQLALIATKVEAHLKILNPELEPPVIQVPPRLESAR